MFLFFLILFFLILLNNFYDDTGCPLGVPVVMSLNCSDAEKHCTLGCQMYTNITYIIYQTKMSVSWNISQSVKGSNSAPCTSDPTLGIPQTKLHDIRGKPGPILRHCRMSKRYQCQIKTKQPLSALKIVWKAKDFLLDPADMWYSHAAAAQQPRRIVPGSNQSPHRKQSKPEGEHKGKQARS